MNDILHNNLTNAIYFEGDNPDEKRYLLLLTLYPDSTDDTSDSYRDWSIKIGRQYKIPKANVISYLMNKTS